MAEGHGLLSRAVAVVDAVDHVEPRHDSKVATTRSPTAVDERNVDGPLGSVLAAPLPLHWPALADVPGAPPRGRWERKLVLSLVTADVLTLVLAVTLSWLARYRFTNENLAFWGFRFPYGVLALVALPLWICGLVVRGSYDRSIIGSSPTEYSRVAGVVMGLLMLISALSFLGSVPVSRGLIAVFFPALLVFSLLGRYGVRKRLHRRRAKGNALRRVVLVGDRAAVTNLTTHLRRSPHAGYEVVGAYLPAADSVVLDDLDLEVLGEPDQLVSDISQQEIDTVAVSGHDLFEHESLRSLAWKLHGTGIQLLMAPDMAEIAGPRIVSRPAGGLPMLLVEEPRTGGPAQFLKALTERGFAALSLLVLSPVFAAIAAAVKLTSPGPVFFRQSASAATATSSRCSSSARWSTVPTTRRRAHRAERRQRRPVQDRRGPARHRRRPLPAALLARRAAPAVERRAGRDEPRRAPPAAADRGRALRRRRRAPTPGQARHHRALAGERSVRPVVGRERAPRPVLRRELVAHARPGDPRQDGEGRAGRIRRLLTVRPVSHDPHAAPTLLP